MTRQCQSASAPERAWGLQRAGASRSQGRGPCAEPQAEPSPRLMPGFQALLAPPREGAKRSVRASKESEQKLGRQGERVSGRRRVREDRCKEKREEGRGKEGGGGEEA
eukprot:3620476-Rhodomonas_salina.3